MNMGQFEPIHDAHAIEQMALVLQTSSPLDDPRLSAVRKALDGFAEELPAATDLQTLQIGVGIGPIGPIAPGNVNGRSRSRLRADGTFETELRVDRGSVAFRTAAYTRWDQVWAQARKLFDAVVGHYVEGSSIGAIGLTFIDRFYWNGEISECRPDSLFRPASAYLAPRVYDTSDLWHSHFGAFVRTDESTKRLLNVNCDCLDESREEGPRRVVVITTAITDMLNQPGYRSMTFDKDSAKHYFYQHVQQMHEDSKATFGGLVTDRIIKRVALFD
jgi:uncharacterized protein (TIGR04255 family)